MTSAPENSTLDPLVEQAKAALDSGDPAGAEQACRKGLSADPAHLELRCLLGAALTLQGRLVKGSQQLRRVVNQDPDFGRGHEELGKTLLAMRKPGEAVQQLQRAIELDPERMAPRIQLAATLFGMGRHEDAGSLCSEIVATNKAPAEALVLLGNAALRAKAFAEGIPLLQRAVDSMPELADSWRLLGELHANLGASTDAIAAYEKGLQLDPESGPLLSLLANELRIVGRHEEAVELYEKCISLYPTVGQVYFSLANLKTYEFDDDLIQEMETQVGTDSLPAESRANFHFALGRAYEDRKQYEQAFSHFKNGNDIRRRSEKFQPALADQAFARIAEVFSKDLIERAATESTNTEATPIFIVGMPRSGSTLLEQILASHSQVEGTHELPDLSRIVQGLAIPRSDTQRFPDAYAALPPESLAQLGEQFLEATTKYRGGQPFFVDKMPNNFSFIGAIRLILPRAKVIDARRNPIDNCMSAYKQLFFGVQSYSYSLADLAQYYLGYHRLMEHWAQAIPGFVLRVDYEAMVADQEQQTRRLLDFCGLEFEEACLRFYETDRAVATASSEQVRQPIYQSAMESWRPYEPYIGELIDGLEPVL